MADKDLELGIVLDTSEAESSLKRLEDVVPKSLEKMIKKFEKLGTQMEKAGGSSTKAAERITKQNKALKDSLKKWPKKLGTTSRN